MRSHALQAQASCSKAASILPAEACSVHEGAFCILQVILSTAPDVSGATHWGQLTFQLNPPINALPGDKLRCSMDIVRQEKNNRLLHVRMIVRQVGESEYAQSASVRELAYKID